MESNQSIKKIITTMSRDEMTVLSRLDENKQEEKVKNLLEQNILPEIKVKRALMWLSNKKILHLKNQFKNFIFLDENGKLYQKLGLPEKRIIDYLKKKTTATIDEICRDNNLTEEEVRASIGILKKKKAIELKKDNNQMIFKITETGKKLSENDFPEQKILNKTFPLEESKLNKLDLETIQLLLRRKKIIYIDNINDQSYAITDIGKKVIEEIKNHRELYLNLEEQLTPEMLKTGEWKNKKFRHYDVSSKVPLIMSGRRHPFNEIMNLLKKIFLEMGFQEMKGPWVETQFWCMDSMWIPQNHPARYAQDTFFIPKKGKLPDKELVKKVKDVHENGATTSSIGHRQPWSEEIAKQLILRTHSTATTFRKLSEINPNKDCKYFYIANNFRNETLDATHLAEFVQAEGFIMADNLTLADLMGFIKEFYSKLGITKIRFKPTYNPYTEPSMEAHYYDEKRKKWYALINSGIFRPEALYPFGIKKRVIAWGMGATRIASILLNKHNIREIVGPKCSFDWIRYHKEIIKINQPLR
ncbi:MAG: phenylalanine--tRNA ligase subunit alpha [Nitrospiraceae bacterium]|nr:phenylalanine--tRNA ligase subunit alpha [Nitrospiraceae bacterium]